MKSFSISFLLLCSLTSLAREGIISVKNSNTIENTLDLTIQGKAAQDISHHLKSNNILFRRDPFSGALVQSANGIRCIDQHKEQKLYCYMAIEGKDIK